MKLKIALLTRAGRPSGALMAWRLLSAGYDPLVLVESRRALHQGSAGASKKGRGSALDLVRRHGVCFLLGRLRELFWIKLHFYARKFLGKAFKSPAFLSIEELALAFPLRLYAVPNHNGPEALQLLHQEKADAGILTNTRRIAPPVLASARLGFFNIHSSNLPKYAGLDAIFWALYHGEKEIGVTVHEAVEKIDQGRIAASARFCVTPWDDESSLARKASWVGTALMMEVLDHIERDQLKLVPQSGEGASYFSWPTAKQRAELKRRRKKEPLISDLSKPRILHVITRMTRGGAQENTLATVRGLAARGYQSVLVTGPSWGPEGEILSGALREGHKIILLPELGREVDLFKDTAAFFRLFFLMRRSRFDLVHTHMSKGGLLGRLAAWLAGQKVIVHTPHGHIFHSYFSRATERFFLFLERRLARITGRLIALTDSEMREHVDFYVGSRSQWRVIPSGVNEALFENPPPAQKRSLREQLGIPEGHMIAGFVGRLEEIKGPLYFVRAMPGILAQMPKTSFLLVGGGRERQRLEEEVRQLGVVANVFFAGDQRQVTGYLSLMDVLIVPSLNEGMGRVIVEAGFLEKPVVASRVGGIPDLILENKTGLLTSPKEPADIERAVVRILGDTLLALRLGRNLKERVLSGFTENQMVLKIESVYREVLESTQTPGACATIPQHDHNPVST